MPMSALSLTAYKDAMERPEGSNDMPPGMKGQPSPGSSSSQTARSSAPDPVPSAEKPVKQDPPDEPMEMDDEAKSESANKKEAEELKAKGNAAYKAKKFDEAVELYQKAWEVYPKDVTFLTNLSGEHEYAAKFSQTLNDES